MLERETLENKSQNYPLKIYKAFNHNEQSMDTLQFMAQELKELYRFFEPALFKGQFFVCKHFKDTFVFDEKLGSLMYDRNPLLNKDTGIIVIQLFGDGRLMYWEGIDTSILFEIDNVLTYMFEGNKEFFIANKEKINITLYPYGSRFATQYFELAKALEDYKVQKVFRSTCPIFSEAWFDDNHIFFKGGGKDIPEKYLQKSLYHYLETNLNLRGITPVLREFNVIGKTPKPVDLLIMWGEANRVALIEVKWLGKSIGKEGNPSRHDNSRANEGIKQLKGYFDTAQANMSLTIIKSYLVVIDARRNRTKKGTVTISTKDGMHYQNIELTIDADKRFYDSVSGFEKPIRMFTAPICS
jgi:hypothetical protein